MVGEWSQPRTSLLLWQAHTACWETGEGAQTRVLHVRGSMTSLGGFKIPWESAVLIFSHLSQLLNIPPLAWVGCQGLRVTQKHLKSIFPKLSGNEVTVPSADAICYTCFYILATENSKGSTVRFWLCYQKKASCFPDGLSSHCVTFNPSDGRKKMSQRPSKFWVPKHTSQKARPHPFANPHTLACPFGMYLALRIVPKPRDQAVHAPRNEPRTPGCRRTDCVFFGKSPT